MARSLDESAPTLLDVLFVIHSRERGRRANASGDSRERRERECIRQREKELIR